LPGRWRLPALLLALAVLLGAFAGYAGQRAHRLRADAATNTALTDSAATSEVTGQITSAVNTIFSYDYTDLAKTQRAASGLLTGAGTCQYDKIFATVREQAPKQKLVVTVTVTNTGVELLDGDRARLLVFATQSSTSAVTKQTSTAGAMFAVDAQRDGRMWRIVGIDTFTGPVDSC
jgi:Mce-associated membrane protein